MSRVMDKTESKSEEKFAGASGKREFGGREILAAMNGLEEELVEIRSQAAKTKKNAVQKKAARTMKWAVAAACSLCLIGGGIVYAASRLNWHVEEYVDENDPQPDMSRYLVEYMPEQVAADAFAGEVRQVEEIFKEQVVNGIYPEDGVPRGWVKEFANEKEAVDYVGYEGLREVALPDWEIWRVDLIALGNREGNLGQVEVSGHYKIGEKLVATTGAEIYTQDWLYESMGTGMPFDDAEDVQGKEYLTRNGKTGLIMAPKYDGEGYFWMEGYMLEGSIVYSLHLVYNSGEIGETGLAEDAVTEIMHEWMEQF